MSHEEVIIGPAGLPGDLVLPGAPASPIGLVLFAHGSGSSRTSSRNRHVAEVLQRRRIGTLLFDLLTDEQARDRGNVFDIGLLARRLIDALDWVAARPELGTLPKGLFGASTGAAAALVAAAERPAAVAAVVARGGRPDLAGDTLQNVRAPTLLIVGANDAEVLELNREAFLAMSCEKRLEVVPRATHLFEEAGTLEQVARLAREWFAARFEA